MKETNSARQTRNSNTSTPSESQQFSVSSKTESRAKPNEKYTARSEKTSSPLNKTLKDDARELSYTLRDLYPMHTPVKDEDRAEGLGTVDVESEQINPELIGKRSQITSVFWISLALVASLVGLSLAFPESFFSLTSAVQEFISVQFGWYYLLLVAIIVLATFYFMISPTGAICLGDPGEKPRFSRTSWIAMLFSAGMGIGLVFWGAAEPLSHFATSAPEAPEMSVQALRDAFRYSFFHWGISAWAIYGIVAMALAYFRFRKKERSLLSVTLKPLFGSAVEGVFGKIVDSITAFATIVGVATSLGFGAAQINGGLNYLFGIPNNAVVQLIIIAITTFFFIMSAVSGLTKGVRILSNINVILAVALVAAVLIVGPTAQIMNVIVTSIGSYLQNFISMSFNIAPYDTAQHAWMEQWTIFYWAWWISWSPFVGVFIARISRGRTIREFLLCVILIPTIFSAIWFAAFGTLSTGAQFSGVDLASLPTEVVLFGTFNEYPLGPVLSGVALLLVFSFFITSADSATFVLGMITENGSLNPHRRTKVVWGLLLSTIAAALLLSGGLDALQNALIITAFPFSIILLLVLLSLVKELRHERLMMGLYIKPTALPEENTPFRSYEDDTPTDPLQVIQEQIQIREQTTEILGIEVESTTGSLKKIELDDEGEYGQTPRVTGKETTPEAGIDVVVSDHTPTR